MSNTCKYTFSNNNLVLKEKFGINCASAEAQFGTGRGISSQIPMIYREIHFNFKLVWSKLHGPTLGKYEIQAVRKSDQDFGTNTVDNECSERTDKLGAELNLL